MLSIRSKELANALDLNAHIDPHLLTGQARIQEIGRLLAIGFKRHLLHQQLLSQQGVAAMTPSQFRDKTRINAKKRTKYPTIPSLTGLHSTSERSCDCI